MWTALACLLIVAQPPAGGKLQIVNPRATFGYLGALRPKGEGGLPGDVFHFRFDIKGMTFDANGRASYSLLVEIADAAGQPLFRLGPTNAVAQNSLGGDTMPCAASLEVPFDTPKGVCSLKVTVEDRVSGRKAVFQAQGKIRPPDFGLVRVGTFADRDAQVPTAPVGVIGETLYVNFAAVGFARDKEKKQPDLDITLRVLNEKGQATMPVPLTGRANSGVRETERILPMQFGLTLNRAGRFTVEVVATDRLAKKTARVTFPLRVLESE